MVLHTHVFVLGCAHAFLTAGNVVLAFKLEQDEAALWATVLTYLTVQSLLFAVFYDLSQRSEEHTSELQSLMRISYAVFCLKQKNNIRNELLTPTTKTRQ